MSIVQLGNKSKPDQSFAFFSIGFRPFFLGASIYAVIAACYWGLVYFSIVQMPNNFLIPSQWHAHEMVYGYAFAVITGFLLTAIENWTGVKTLNGWKLGILFALWLVARILINANLASSFYLGMLFDLVFDVLALFSVFMPVKHSRQWSQIGIISKVGLLVVGNMLFYLGVLGIVQDGCMISVYAGVFVVVSLVLTIVNRVLPSFITNIVNCKEDLRSPKWMASVTLVLFVVFFINQLLIHNVNVQIGTCFVLFVVSSLRLIKWHHRGIWSKPLLWSLYVAAGFINLAFLLFSIGPVFSLSPYLPLHAFTYGGIGISTLGMMARASLGHTGRDVRNPPLPICYAIKILTLGAVIRVLFPVVDMGRYQLWILLSQGLWILAFSIFSLSTMRILVRP